MLIRGSVALNIFVAIAALYFIWQLTKSLHMEMISSILGQIMGIGVIALLIVFQQDIRRFLIMIGNRYFTANNKFSLEKFFSFNLNPKIEIDLDAIALACEKMSAEKTGALIVIARKMDLQAYSEIGEDIMAKINSHILLSIFQKDSPLHDGAVIIQNNKIKAARCILPLSENPNLPSDYGMRHRSALGMSEVSDALIVVVSEQTGQISVALRGEIISNLDRSSLKILLLNELSK
jgi:uncharacterized protein (TIGR00159 family)